MYKITADYHTHTIYSHGKGTIEDNVKEARAKGLKKIAIADHGFRHIGYGMEYNDIPKMRMEIDRLNEKYDDIQVLLGIEANLIGLDGRIDIPDKYMDSFDIILMGFHKAVIPYSFMDAWKLYARNAFESVLKVSSSQIRHDNTVAMINAINRYPIDIITHPGAKIDIDTDLLAQYAAKKNTALEINASHGFMTVEYVKIALKRDARFVINSDAHTPCKVGVFDRAMDIALKAGLNADNIINAEEQ